MTDETGTCGDDTEHFEGLYHCNQCRRVYYLERTDRKIQHTCGNCGPRTFFKITASEVLDA